MRRLRWADEYTHLAAGQSNKGSFPREVIHDREDAEPAAVAELIVQKIQ